MFGYVISFDKSVHIKPILCFSIVSDARTGQCKNQDVQELILDPIDVRIDLNKMQKGNCKDMETQHRDEIGGQDLEKGVLNE